MLKYMGKYVQVYTTLHPTWNENACAAGRLQITGI